jgi:hypothetical protein
MADDPAVEEGLGEAETGGGNEINQELTGDANVSAEVSGEAAAAAGMSNDIELIFFEL